MAFVPETGAGLSDANSYTSVATADAYFTLRGNTTWSGASTSAKQIALVEASKYITDTYGANWRGSVTSTTQALDWPRGGVIDGDTQIQYDSDVIPTRLNEATSELAVRRIAGTDLRPDMDASADSVSSSTVSVGGVSISETFAGVQSGAPRFLVVEHRLRSLVAAGMGGSMVRVIR